MGPRAPRRSVPPRDGGSVQSRRKAFEPFQRVESAHCHCNHCSMVFPGQSKYISGPEFSCSYCLSAANQISAVSHHHMWLVDIQNTQMLVCEEPFVGSWPSLACPERGS